MRIFLLIILLSEVRTMAANTSLVKSRLGLPVQEFTTDLFRKFPRDENLFFSPFSISTAMAMVQMGAKEKTLTEMTRVLKFQKSDEELYNAFHDYIQIVKKGDDSVTLKTANRLYPSKKFSVSKSYIQECSKQFQATVESLDFGKSEESRAVINKWVESQTNDKIKDLLPEGSLNDLTALVLVNAIYFKGNWDAAFKKEMTKKMMFESPKKQIEVEMMYQKEKFGYRRDHSNQVSVLELPYKGRALSMIIVLPDDKRGLGALEDKLTSDMLAELTENLPPMKVDTWIPKFKMEFTATLKDTFTSMGMIDAFHRDNADFSGIFPSKDVYIDEVYHKAYVEVNEEGTEAAAATGVVMMKRSIMITPEFRADHPFLFFIKDVSNGVILFAGRVMEPQMAVQKSGQKDEL